MTGPHPAGLRYVRRVWQVHDSGGVVGLAKGLWRRHRWSVPLSVGSAIFFLRLGTEMRQGQLDAFDEAIQRSVDGWRGREDVIMLAATRAGSFLPMTSFTALVLLLLVLGRRPREARYLLVSAGGCLLLNVALKLAFHRARPSALPYLIARPTSLSFPSGHTMGTAGVIGSLVVIAYAVQAGTPLRWLVTALGAGVVLCVGVSRVYLGAHYPSDVLGGFLAAGAWISAATGWAYPRLLPGERAPLGMTPPPKNPE